MDICRFGGEFFTQNTWGTTSAWWPFRTYVVKWFILSITTKHKYFKSISNLRKWMYANFVVKSSPLWNIVQNFTWFETTQQRKRQMLTFRFEWCSLVFFNSEDVTDVRTIYNINAESVVNHAGNESYLYRHYSQKFFTGKSFKPMHLFRLISYMYM
jgi:hypothetical protein